MDELNFRLQLQLEAARKYSKAGISVIPVAYESKYPDVASLARIGGTSSRGFASFKPFQARFPTELELEIWFSKRQMNLGIVLGFNDLYALDFDDEDSYWKWVESCPQWSEKLPTQRTSRGYHVIFKSPNLASAKYRTFLPVYLLNEPEFPQIARLESMGQWILGWPSIHPDGSQYKWCPGKAPWEIEVPVIPDMESLNLEIKRLKPGIIPFIYRWFKDPALAKSQWREYVKNRHGEFG